MCFKILVINSLFSLLQVSMILDFIQNLKDSVKIDLQPPEDEALTIPAQKMKFSIEDFFSKGD